MSALRKLRHADYGSTHAEKFGNKHSCGLYSVKMWQRDKEIALLKRYFVMLVLLSAGTVSAEEKIFTIAGGQVSVPVGLMVQVKSITVADDATKVHILASFDSQKTNSVDMNDSENAYLSWGESEQSRLHLRQVSDNRWMRIANGQSMEGDLVFPGTIPADVRKVSLVFNPGNGSDNTDAPGVTIPLELKP